MVRVWSGRSFNIKLQTERNPKMLKFRDPADLDAYDDALMEFERTGDRPTLLRALFALGVEASLIRWHAAVAGRRMVALAPG